MTTKEYIEKLRREVQKEEIRALAADSKAEIRTHIESAKKKRELLKNLINLGNGGIYRAVRRNCIKAL